MLHDYDWVLHLDSDALVLENIDELFFDQSFDFAYTADYAMDGGNSAAPPVQGGLMLMKPNEGRPWKGGRGEQRGGGGGGRERDRERERVRGRGK
jgi:hypothetical protein